MPVPSFLRLLRWRPCNGEEVKWNEQPHAAHSTYVSAFLYADVKASHLCFDANSKTAYSRNWSARAEELYWPGRLPHAPSVLRTGDSFALLLRRVNNGRLMVRFVLTYKAVNPVDDDV